MKLTNKIIGFTRTASYRYPVTIVLIAALLAATGGYIYFFKLPIISDRTQLINQDLETNRIYGEYRDQFGDEQVLVLVVCTSDSGETPVRPNSEQRRYMKQIATHWANELRQHPDLFPNVWERIEGSDWNSLALLYLEMNKLEALTDALNRLWPNLEKWLRSPSFANLFAILNTSLKEVGENKSPIDREQMPLVLEGLTDLLYWLGTELSTKALETNGIGRDFYSFFNQGHFDLDGYIFSDDGNLLTAYATVAANSNQRNRYAEVMEFAQAAIKKALAETPQSIALEAGLAGMPALEYEELHTAQRDFSRSVVIALLCVTILFMLGFRNILRPALAALSLCLAIGVTFGFAWLIIGHLNVLAMIFTVILVALGIDFAIHFVTHYELALSEGCSSVQAIRKTYSTIGGALWMGGITTATAFLSAYFTEFAGLAELGLIAGGGVFICLLCMYLVYPAMLFLLDRRRPSGPSEATRKFLNPIEYITPWLNSKKAKWLLAVSLILLSLGYIFGQYKFDTNLLNLQAVDSDANRWQRTLLSTEDRSLFAITTYNDRNSLERARSEFEAAPAWVQRTQSLFPSLENRKRKILAGLCEKIRSVQVAQPEHPSVIGLKRQIWNFRQVVRKYSHTNAEAKTALADLEREISSVYRTLDTLPEKKLERKLAQVERNVFRDLEDRLPELKKLFCPSAVSRERLPESLKSRFLGKDGSLALYIYPSKNVWEQANLEEFVQKAREIEPKVFGEIVSLYENGQSLIRSFLQASGYSLSAILVLLLLWTRSARTTLFSMVPLISSVGLLLGIMQLIPIQWNFTNFFALPILIGIGVDSGIHLVKAWKDGDSQTFKGSGKAVFLSSATTIIGFGILAASNHLGVSSLGWVLFLGISFSLLVSLVTLPAALKIVFMKD